MRLLHDRPGLGLWLGVVLTLSAVVVLSVAGPAHGPVWESPVALFWVVVVAAGLCVLASAGVIAVGLRDRTAEIGMLGGALVALSTLALVHGFTVPGVLYGPNRAVTTSSLLSLPAALCVAAPLLAARTAWARAVARRWRVWVLAWTAAVLAVSALLLAAPDAVALPAPRSPISLALALVSLGAMLALSYRQLHLYWVGELRGTLVGALGLALVGITAIQWIGDRPYGIGFWLLHLIDTAGVLAAALAVAMGHRAERRVADILLPVLERDPLAAMEVGMAPVVRRFVAALGEKDAITRDHVVRVGELAMRAGERRGLKARRLRHLGLAAILHDVGKLTVSDEILTKPGRLTADEFERMKRLTIDGERLLRSTPGLEPAARLVRSHHERVDGHGYPDGLSGDAIPFEARIIAACDGYDAMARTRHYREGLGHLTAASILEEHAGSQWDPQAVAHVLAVVRDSDELGRQFEGIDRAGAHHSGQACADALPEEVVELLAALAD
jgi:HD-GYP domain-containing protein (c-di-GMP phosphodiesterase class II)